VLLSLTLPIPLSAFNASVQQSLKEVLAVAAGLTRADSARVALTARASRRRLLASGGVAVDAAVSMPDAAAASRAVAGLTADRINAGLAAAGLPPATIPAPATTFGRAARGAAGGAALALLAAGAVGLAAVW
jgi:hypothetical protein